MLGHTPSGNDLAYFHHDINKLKELYIKYLPHLTFEKTIVVRSLDTEETKRLGELELENENLKKLVSSIKSDMDAQKKTDDSLALELEKRMEELIEKRAAEILEQKLKGSAGKSG